MTNATNDLAARASKAPCLALHAMPNQYTVIMSAWSRALCLVACVVRLRHCLSVTDELL